MRERILAHRGLWSHVSEKNSSEALSKALQLGFGVEYDVRDQNGELVVSHDPAVGENMKLIDFLEFCSAYQTKTQLHAINIKSDGLTNLFIRYRALIERNAHFFFDMSSVEEYRYRALGLEVARRISEIDDVFIDSNYKGHLWIDSFHSDWWINYDFEIFHKFASAKICFVSPELHGRSNKEGWAWLAQARIEGHKFSICTDNPFEAERVIYG